MKAERKARSDAKAIRLRTLATRNYTKKDLLEIFGLAITQRLHQNPYHSSVGKSFFSNRFHAGSRNPAGSKLLRRFIRDSSKEQASMRKMYAALTGRQYNHLNTSDA